MAEPLSFKNEENIFEIIHLIRCGYDARFKFTKIFFKTRSFRDEKMV